MIQTILLQLLKAFGPQVIEVLFKYLVQYIQSTDTTKDDTVLKIAQTTCSYLASVPTTTVTVGDAESLNSRTVTDIFTAQKR